MATYNYNKIYIDEYGRHVYTDVTGTYDTECAVTSKAVAGWDGSSIDPAGQLDTDIDSDLSGQCGVNVNTADDYERFPNHTSTTITVTNFVLADPANTSVDVYHQKYFVWLEAAGKRLAYGTDGHQHQYYIDKTGGNNDIKLNINPRGQNIIAEVRK